MSGYTPGHALNDIRALPDKDPEAVTPLLVLLFKSGQTNERAAIVAELRAYARRVHRDLAGPYELAALLIERGEL